MSQSISPNPPFSDVALESVKKIKQPLLLFGVVETVLLIFLLVIGRDIPKGLAPVMYALIAFIMGVAVGTFALEYHKQKHRFSIEEGQKVTRVPEVLPRKRNFPFSDSPEFRAFAENRMLKANRVILIGTGLNILEPDPFTKKLLERASQGECQLEIYLADPTNPAVEMRLIEEELGDIKPKVGRDGIFQRIERLLGAWNNLGRPNTININLFAHYPTFALLIIDRDYFIYPYGYATLGNFSPVLWFSKDIPADQDVIAFFDKQYHLVKSSALNVETIHAILKHKCVNMEKLYPLALYFIPSKEWAIYKFGTQVLGYDVRERKLIDTPWQKQVGKAREFGFHVTLCDVLYFVNQAEIKSILADLEFLAEEFAPFELTGLHLKSGFPDATSISVMMEDPSGSFEALHCELVHRVYRRAVASDYSLGLTKQARDKNIKRSELMIKRYRAPYVLQHFHPHFTLLTQVSLEEQSKRFMELERIFTEKACEQAIPVERLAVMSRPAPDAPWIIEKEIELG